MNYNESRLVKFDAIRVMILGKRKSTVNVQTEKDIKRKRKGRE